jgi:hypothetical protein
VVRSHTELGWKKRASVWIDVPFVNRTFATDEGGAAVSSTGLGDLDLGLRLPIRQGHMPIAIELGWIAPMGSNRKIFPGTGGGGGMDGTSYLAQATGPVRDSSAFFNTGLQSLSAAIEFGGSAGKKSYWTAGGGFRSNYLTPGARGDEDRQASFVDARASFGTWLGTHLLVSGDFAGEWARQQGNPYDRIATDVPGDNGPQLQPSSIIVGPRFTYRVDDRMDMFAGSWHTASGRNVLHTDQFYAGIAWKQTGLDRLAGAMGGTKAH